MNPLNNMNIIDSSTLPLAPEPSVIDKIRLSNCMERLKTITEERQIGISPLNSQSLPSQPIMQRPNDPQFVDEAEKAELDSVPNNHIPPIMG